jgi:SMODS-associated and fused to various effectors sensor domain
MKSARYYDPQTLKLLWGRAAGRCAMPSCRIELFITDDDYDPVCVIGEMGHIAASSDGGPRANQALTSRERDSYANLVLFCRNCHRQIDTLKQSYPEQRLREIKANHEAWVRTALPERGFSQRKWSVLRLQGDFPFDPTTITESLSPDQEEREAILSVSPSRCSWDSIQSDLRFKIQAWIAGSETVGSRFAVFPLAPVSACMYAGFLLTNRLNVRSFQYHRDRASWVWSKSIEASTAPTVTPSTTAESAHADVFFLFELTAPIDASAVVASIPGDKALYRCSVPNKGTSWLQEKSQLDELARKAREMFETAAVAHSSSAQWHILYAGPAPGAVAVGQQLNPTMIPPVQLYEFQRPHHIPSIKITTRDSLLTNWTAL